MRPGAGRWARTALAVTLAGGLVAGPALRRPEARVVATAHAAVAAPVFDHRVVVATTSLDRELDVEASLERQVNRLGALGYELTALVGGDPRIIDRLLARKTYVPGLVDHSGFTFAIMARPVDQPVVAREYRLLHLRTGLGVDALVAPLGRDGYRLTVTALEGDIVHLAFERAGGAPAVEYRAFRNRGRQDWMQQALADPDARMRITRVMPVALDTAVVELGAAQSTPVDMKWLTTPGHLFTSLERPLGDLATAGYHVDLVRARLNDVSILVVKPSGVSSGTANYDLDDGPWGGPCGRGTLAGVAVLPDGDVACAADTSGTAADNRGLDLTLREQPSAGGQILFRGPDCDIRARLASARAAAPRVALATQFEREIRAQLRPGYRVVRALAASDSNGQMRIVAMTSDAPVVAPSGPPVAPAEPAPLTPDVDGVGQDLTRQREDRLNAAIAAMPALRGQTLWLELDERRPSRTARLLGCVPTSAARDLAASAASGVLINQGLIDYRVDSRVVVDR